MTVGTSTFHAAVLLASSALSFAACASGEAATPAAPAPVAAPAAPSTPAPAVDPVAEARQIFAARCTPCHGAEGRGDGAASKGLTPPPRDFGDGAWQASVTDDHLEKIVQYGGAAVGKSPAMPANPDLMSKPEVVKALAGHVRSLKR